MLTLRFYGQLTERMGAESRQLDFAGNTIGELRQWLRQEYPFLQEMEIKLAQQNRICSDDAPLQSQPVDVFPPFSGG